MVGGFLGSLLIMIGDEGFKFFKGNPVSALGHVHFQLVAVEWRFLFHWSRCPRCFHPVRVKVKLVGLGACSVLGFLFSDRCEVIFGGFRYFVCRFSKESNYFYFVSVVKITPASPLIRRTKRLFGSNVAAYSAIPPPSPAAIAVPPANRKNARLSMDICLVFAFVQLISEREPRLLRSDGDF